MAYPKVWYGNPVKKVLQVPVDIAESAMALALLLDKRDPELLDFLASRFIPAPADR